MKFTSSKLIVTGVAVITSFTLIACGGGSDSTSVESSQPNTVNVSNKKTDKNISPEKMGTDGKYDEHALAKKVAQVLDNSAITGSNKVYVAQSGTTIFLKGNVSNRSALENIVAAVKKVQGVQSVNTDGITLK